jgi:hypothetical protein
VVDPGETLGVAWWWLARRDGRADGRHDEYLSDARWRALDPELFGVLAGRPARDVAGLETLDLWPGRTLFHRDAVPGKLGRAAWSGAMLRRLAEASVVFADPDNGVSRPGTVSPKSATIDEALSLAANGRSVLLIRFPHRMNSHEEQLAHYHATFADPRPVTVRTCVRVTNANGSTSPRIRWFTALNPTPAIVAGVEAFATAVRQLPGASAMIP